MKKGKGDPIHNPLPPVSLNLSGKLFPHLCMPPAPRAPNPSLVTLKTNPSSSVFFLYSPGLTAASPGTPGLLFPSASQAEDYRMLLARGSWTSFTPAMQEMELTSQCDCFLLQETLDM